MLRDTFGQSLGTYVVEGVAGDISANADVLFQDADKDNILVLTPDGDNLRLETTDHQNLAMENIIMQHNPANSFG